jgi:acetoin utilization deacetylase AcuC-like enzyme
MSLVIVTSSRFADHLNPPGHPERVERAEVMEVVAGGWKDAGGAVLEPRAATDDDLARVHSREHIARITATRGRASKIDEDTFTSPESEEVARLAAGAVLTAVDAVLGVGTANRLRQGYGGQEAVPDGSRAVPDDPQAVPCKHALAMVRPPGHHAEGERAMGFCLYNNIAVGAAYARSRGCARVAIVDFDVHHGNGTQWIFYGDPTVLFVSSHQYPFYPGTGAASEIGSGAGAGFTLNLPLTIGTQDIEIERLYASLVVPKVRAFKPDLLMISAGFDAHEEDPLGQLRLTTAGFGRLTRILLDLADEVCGGKVVLVTEGGYDTHALAACLRAVIDVCK